MNGPADNGHGTVVGDAASRWETIAAIIRGMVTVNRDLIERHCSAITNAAAARVIPSANIIQDRVPRDGAIRECQGGVIVQDPATVVGKSTARDG